MWDSVCLVIVSLLLPWGACATPDCPVEMTQLPGSVVKGDLAQLRAAMPKGDGLTVQTCVQGACTPDAAYQVLPGPNEKLVFAMKTSGGFLTWPLEIDNHSLNDMHADLKADVRRLGPDTIHLRFQFAYNERRSVCDGEPNFDPTECWMRGFFVTFEDVHDHVFRLDKQVFVARCESSDELTRPTRLARVGDTFGYRGCQPGDRHTRWFSVPTCRPVSAPKATELLSLARQASRAGRHLEAKKRGNALVRAEPGVPIFLFERGRIRLAAGDRRGGESDLLDVAHSDIADPILKTRALTALGASQAAAGDRAGALASFKDAFSIVPSPALERAIQALKSKGQTCVPHERTFRGIEYVRVCAGTFDMGLRLTGKARRIAMQSFWIGKYEITNAQYGARMHPDDPSEKAKAAWPVSNVSRRNAQVFCEAAGARLPSTTEWEYAARGPDARAYPWGNATPSPERAVYSPVGQPTDAPEPVGRRPKGVGPFGTHNQAGNVAEWVTGCPASLSEAEPDSVPTDAADCDIGVVRGGAFSRSAGALHAAHSAPEIQSRHESVGFRCVLSPAP